MLIKYITWVHSFRLIQTYFLLQFNITIGLELHNDQQLEIIKS